MTDLESRAKIAAQGMMDVGDIMHRLREIADRAYSPLEATATAFMNNSTALNDIGLSMRQQLDMTDALTNALVVSGAKGHQFELVMNAINSSLATGKMVGRELEMVMKYGGKVAEGMARSLGTTVNGLKEMAREGKLTSKVIFDALVGNLERWQEEADSMPATIGDALVRLQNQITSSIGDLNRDFNISNKVVSGIDLLKNSIAGMAENLPTVIAALGAFALVKANIGKAATGAASGLLSSTLAIKRDSAAAQAHIGISGALRQAITGVSTSLNSQLTAWELLKIKVTGDTSALTVHTQKALADAKANQARAVSTTVAAKAAQQNAAAALAASTSTIEQIHRKGVLSQKTRELVAALEAERIATAGVMAAETANSAATQAATMATARQALEETKSAIAKNQLVIAGLKVAATRAAELGNLAAYERLMVRIGVLEQKNIALTANKVVLTNQLAAAQERLEQEDFQTVLRTPG